MIKDIWHALGPILPIFLVLPFVFDPGLSDRYFALRVIILSVGLMFSFLWLIYKKTQELSINILDLLIGLFVFWVWISSTWVINVSEAIVNNIRFTLGVGIYFFWRFHTSQPAYNFKTLTTVIHLVGLIYIVVAWIGIIKFGTEFSFSNKDLYRLQYPAGHKSIIAAYILLSLPFAMVDTSRPRIRFITVFFGVGALLMLQSRAAFLGLLSMVVVAMVLFIKNPKLKAFNRFLPLLLIVFFLGFWGVENQAIFQRLNLTNYIKSETAQERFISWHKTWNIIKDYPIRGVGSGNWKIHFPSEGLEKQWVFKDRDVIFTRAHNDYLEIMAEGGIIGIVLWFLVLLLPIIMAVKHRHTLSGKLCIIFLMAYLTISVFDFPKERMEITLLFWSVLGISGRWFNSIGVVRGITWVWLGIILLMVGLMIPKYVGEKNLVHVLNARARQDWNAVARHADKAFSRLYSTDPYAMPVMWYKGLAEYQLGKTEQAHKSFLNAYQQHPWQYHILNNLATTYFSKGDLENALMFYNRCQAVNPYFQDIYFNKAVVLTQMKRFDEARQSLMYLDSNDAKVIEFLNEITKQENQERNN